MLKNQYKYELWQFEVEKAKYCTQPKFTHAAPMASWDRIVSFTNLIRLQGYDALPPTRPRSEICKLCIFCLIHLSIANEIRFLWNIPTKLMMTVCDVI